jgi:hypothetical protein
MLPVSSVRMVGYSDTILTPDSHLTLRSAFHAHSGL